MFLHWKKKPPKSYDLGGFFVKRKPRDSRVVEKRLTGEENPPFVIRLKRPGSHNKHKRRILSMKKVSIDANSLAYTKWECKYHIVFASKYRRKVFLQEKRADIREILRQLCQ